MTLRRGGKTVFGASVGILMLETRFPRIPGDIGNALTWPFPVQFRVVRGATPERIVQADPMRLVDDFIAAGRDLVAMGCDGIATTCGFLALMQDRLATALEVPVATSSLMQIPMVQATLPTDRRVGVLTVSAATLTPAHLRAAGAPADTPIVGTENGSAFSATLLGNRTDLDVEACRRDLLDAADALLAREPKLGAIVLECTNMVPYAADIRAHTGLPVYSIYSFIVWFQAGLTPRRFPTGLDDPRLS